MAKHTFSKCIIITFASIVIIISVGLIVLGILIESSDLFDFELPQYNQKVDPEKWVDISGWIFIGVGSFIFLSSIAGIYGALKLKKCLMCFYWITLVLLFLLFLGLTIAFPVILNPLYSEIDKSNCQYDDPNHKFSAVLHLMNDTNALYLDLSEQVYCQKYTIQGQDYECACYIENPQIWEKNLGQDFFENYTISNDKPNNPIRVDQCPNFTQVLSEDISGIDQELYNQVSGFANYVETTFDCTGVCEGTPFYMFSDINRGIPEGYASESQTGGCKQKIVNFVGSYKDVTFYSVLGALILITINHFLIFYLCCQHKKNPDYLSSYLELAGDGQHQY